MWGHFRVEWEHIKYSTKDTAGFFDTSILETSTTLSIIHNDILENKDVEMNNMNINSKNNPNNIYNDDNEDDDSFHPNNTNIDIGRELDGVISSFVFVAPNLNKSSYKNSIESKRSLSFKSI
jgi:hypothetical protein